MKRILVISHQSMFWHGLDSLLRRQPELEIVGHETDASTAVERIQELRPDVVIVDGNDTAHDPALVAMHILKDGLKTKVIELNLRDNTVYIYRGEQRVAQGVEDLLEAIEEERYGSEPASAN